jgi:hypothetical protein
MTNEFEFPDSAIVDRIAELRWQLARPGLRHRHDLRYLLPALRAALDSR